MTKQPRTNSKTMRRAANLRKNMTDTERKLWAYLERNQLGVSFRRQHAIGDFIVDFCCVKKVTISSLRGSFFAEAIPNYEGDCFTSFAMTFS